MSVPSMNFTNAAVTQDDGGMWHATCQFWDTDGVSYTWAKENFEDHVAAKAWIDDLKATVSTWRTGSGLAGDPA